MTANDTKSPAERIAAMQKAVADKAARERAEKDRKRLRDAAERKLRDELYASLRGMEELPLSPEGYAHVEAGLLDGNVHTVDVCRVVLTGSSRERTIVETLASFCVLSDRDDHSQVWIAHDGDAIELDVAQDLAVAAVEAKFRS